MRFVRSVPGGRENTPSITISTGEDLLPAEEVRTNDCSFIGPQQLMFCVQATSTSGFEEERSVGRNKQCSTVHLPDFEQWRLQVRSAV